eukprot:1891661-Pleurochrysis_carterae.AAC.4
MPLAEASTRTPAVMPVATAQCRRRHSMRLSPFNVVTLRGRRHFRCVVHRVCACACEARRLCS